jgi:hypothetical protein
VKDKLFFFGAYQGTVLRQRPTSNIEYVPTAAMLAGDFTTSLAACNGGRQVTLRRRSSTTGAAARSARGAEHREEAADDDRSVRA